MHNVHETQPVVFETRWTLSYLRGPMGATRSELKRRRRAADVSRLRTTSGRDHAHQAEAPRDRHAAATPPSAACGARPVVPAGIQEVFVAGCRAGGVRATLYGVGAGALHRRETRRSTSPKTSTS